MDEGHTVTWRSVDETQRSIHAQGQTKGRKRRLAQLLDDDRKQREQAARAGDGMHTRQRGRRGAPPREPATGGDDARAVAPAHALPAAGNAPPVSNDALAAVSDDDDDDAGFVQHAPKRAQRAASRPRTTAAPKKRLVSRIRKGVKRTQRDMLG